MNVRVRYAETDAMGVAHHGAYVVWLETARVEWMRERGLSYRELDDSGVAMAVAGLEVRYRAAARFDDVLHLDCRLERLRSRYGRFRYAIRHEDGRLIATAVSEHVPTDRRGRAVRLPRPWLDALAPHVEPGGPA
jgi:acyl-CoA thioester hydrolase